MSGSSAVDEQGPTIWSIAGGKGGVGKSLVCSSLAISFARRGQSCALIDLDLGAANAHSLLGMRSPPRTLSDVIERRVDGLADILHPTPFPNLWLAGGARASLDLANPKYSQKERLLRQIRSLDVEHVFLDLSAGCAFNVLDFFLAARHRLAVLVPEATAIENGQHFLKAAFFRSLRPLTRQEPLGSLLRQALVSPERPVSSARDLVEAVGRLDATAGEVLARQARAFAPTLVVNQVAGYSRIDAVSRAALACRHYLAAGVRERGRLPRDERVREAVSRGVHVLQAFPGSRFATAIESLAHDLDPRTASAAVTTIGQASAPSPTRPALPPGDHADPGEYLRRCREALGLSLADVCRQTRIRSLGRIEDGRYRELPGERYVAAFVRQYAEVLGIRDADRLTARYLVRYRTALAS